MKKKRRNPQKLTSAKSRNKTSEVETAAARIETAKSGRDKTLRQPVREVSHARPMKSGEQTQGTGTSGEPQNAKKTERPTKHAGGPPKLYLAGHHLRECPQHIRSMLPEIRSWLVKAKFGEGGLRKIEKSDLCEAEWNFSSISDPREAHFVHEYEYLRECKIAYKYRADYLRTSRTPEAWGRAWQEFQKTWPTDPSFSNRCPPLFDFFPMPYLTLPADVRERIRTRPGHRWSGKVDLVVPKSNGGPTFPLVEEMDLESFVEERPADNTAFAETLGEPRYHCLRMRWGFESVPRVQAALLKWFRSVRPACLASPRGRPAEICVEDGLAQLSAWRAQRAGVLSDSDYRELLKNAGISVNGGMRGFVRSYDDPSAYRHAAELAGKKIEALRAV